MLPFGVIMDLLPSKPGITQYTPITITVSFQQTTLIADLKHEIDLNFSHTLKFVIPSTQLLGIADQVPWREGIHWVHVTSFERKPEHLQVIDSDHRQTV
jgi:hypothetical protein